MRRPPFRLLTIGGSDERGVTTVVGIELCGELAGGVRRMPGVIGDVSPDVVVGGPGQS